MTASLLPEELEISGMRARWTWASEDTQAAGGLPTGLVLDHGDHEVLVPWAPYDGGPTGVFTLDSLLPLTVVERIGCYLCGAEGRIERGAWLPLKGGVAR